MAYLAAARFSPPGLVVRGAGMPGFFSDGGAVAGSPDPRAFVGAAGDSANAACEFAAYDGYGVPQIQNEFTPLRMLNQGFADISPECTDDPLLHDPLSISQMLADEDDDEEAEEAMLSAAAAAAAAESASSGRGSVGPSSAGNSTTTLHSSCCEQMCPHPAPRNRGALAADPDKWKKESLVSRRSLPSELRTIFQHDIQPFPNMSPKETLALKIIREELLVDPKSANHDIYVEKLSLLAFAEEYQSERELRKYAQRTWVWLDESRMYMRLPGIVDGDPHLQLGDRVSFYLGGAGAVDSTWLTLMVESVQNATLIFRPSQRTRESMFSSRAGVMQPQEKFLVRFELNRLTYRIMHTALSLLTPDLILRLFPDHYDLLSHVKMHLKIFSIPEKHEVDWFNPKLTENDEQVIAVRHILGGTSQPYPYLLFGPPGTGKSTTLVEAILQVWKRRPESRIIVGAQSNAAADVLAVRLHEHVGKGELVRLVAASREHLIDPLVAEIVQSDPIAFDEQCKDIRIFVVTLHSSGRFVAAKFPKGHFTHVFIDEAGQATEAETAIPLAGILAETGQLVLAGDPHQLGPIIRSITARDHGMERSLLERLMTDCSLYRKSDEEDPSYETRVITKLVRNFRSHQALLDPPSRLFYDNELIPAADPSDVNSLLHWEGLPKKGFPLIFHGANGVHENELKLKSFFNVRESAIVVDYVVKLMKLPAMRTADIGVLTPYRRQVRYIKDELMGRNLAGVKVGSTEKFQGQERKVMIISTVRSASRGVIPAGPEPSSYGGCTEKTKTPTKNEKPQLGFLSNPKRFNVAVTRAKALLIIVGNPTLLNNDINWRTMIEYAKENGAFLEDDDVQAHFE